MKEDKVLIELVVNNVSLGKITKNKFEETTPVHAKQIESGPAPSPVSPKSIEKVEPKFEPKGEPKFEPAPVAPKAEPKVEPTK